MEAAERYELAKAQAVTALVTASQSLFFDVEKFEHAQRVARMLATSTLVPEHFRNNLGNCVIALNYAERIKADPFMVMQNMYVVHGRPGVEGKLIIALVNQSGRFEPLEFEEEKNSCTAYAKEIKSGKVLRGPTIDIEMVKAEGWLGKNGSKWATMPQIMFRYRAATFFARTYCPEVLLGMKTVDELEDMIELKPQKNGTYAPELPLPAGDLKSKVEAKLNALKDDGQITPEVAATAAPEAPLAFKCVSCGYEAASERGLKKHMTQSHSIKESEQQKTQAPPPLVEFPEDKPEANEDPRPAMREFIRSFQAELEPKAWELVVKMYPKWETEMDIEQLNAMIKRCEQTLDKQNQG